MYLDCSILSLLEYKSKRPCYHVFLEVESSGGSPQISKAQKKLVTVFVHDDDDDVVLYSAVTLCYCSMLGELEKKTTVQFTSDQENI